MSLQSWSHLRKSVHPSVQNCLFRWSHYAEIRELMLIVPRETAAILVYVLDDYQYYLFQKIICCIQRWYQGAAAGFQKNLCYKCYSTLIPKERDKVYKALACEN